MNKPKRAIALGVILAVVFNLFGSISFAENQKIVDEAFDQEGNGTVGKFDFWPSNGKVSREQVPGKTGKSVVLESSANYSSQQPQLNKIIAPPSGNGSIIIEALVMANNLNVVKEICYVKDNKNYGLSLVRIGTNGQIYAVGESGKQTAVMPYELGTWIQLQVVLDMSRKTMDIYINGKKKIIRYKVNSGADVSNLAAVKFFFNDTAGSGSKLLVDDVKVYMSDTPEKMGALPPPIDFGKQLGEGVEVTPTPEPGENDEEVPTTPTLPTTGQVTMPGQSPQPESFVYTYEDFNEPSDCTSTGWTFSVGNNSSNSILRKTIAGRNDKVLVMSTEEVKGTQTLSIQKNYPVPLTGKAVFEAEVMVGDRSVQRDIFLLTGSNLKTSSLLQLNNKGMITVNGVSVMRYPVKQWMKVQILLDLDSKTEDVFIDGKKVLTKATIQNDLYISDIKSVQMTESSTTAVSGTLYMDNVKVYRGSEIVADHIVQTEAPVKEVKAPKKSNQAYDAFDIFRERWKDVIISVSEKDAKNPDYASKIASATSSARSAWENLSKEGGSVYLWKTLAKSTSSSRITSGYTQIKSMAIGYKTPGSPLYRDAKLREDILYAFEWMYQNHYNDKKAMVGNWWDYQIGGPLSFNDALVLMYDELSEEQLIRYLAAEQHFMPNDMMTGANRVWLCEVKALYGCLLKDYKIMNFARDELSPVFEYVTKEDGFYEDGSFIQHYNHPYTGGYGKALLSEIAKLITRLKGTPWQITDPKQKIVYDWVYEAFEPLIYQGNLMSMVRGREISRVAYSDLSVGVGVIGTLLSLAEVAPPADKLKIKSMVKYWISSNPKINVNSSLTYKRLMEDERIPVADAPQLYKQYAAMDRAVQYRPDYAFALSMSSNRIYNYEAVSSGENGKAWYTGQGMTYLYDADAYQFSDHFWPTVDPYKMPGTTVDVKERAFRENFNHLSPESQVGGVSLDNLYGVSCMAVNLPLRTLKAKKSWFMFDDEIVALGAGINSTDEADVHTIMENRMINSGGTNELVINGEVKPNQIGWSEKIGDVKWAHLEGNTKGYGIGYFLPNGGTVEGLREARTGCWKDVNLASGTETLYTRNYLNLAIDHGINPNRATYSYVLLPGKTTEETSAYAKNPDIEIIENNEKVQAVRENKQNITGATFWTDEVNSAGGITCDKKASVMMRQTEDEIEIAVSDPTQANQGRITVEVAQAGAAIIQADTGILVESVGPVIRFSVDVHQAKGKTFTLKVRKSNEKK